MPNAGDTIRATDFPTAKINTVGTAGTTTSASYTATLTGSTAPGVAFVAPTSGNVVIHIAAEMSNSAANYSFISFTVKTGAVVGSGSAVTGGTTPTENLHNGTLHTKQGVSYVLTGLTAGTDYNAQMMFKVSAGTGTFQNMDLAVFPTT